MCYLGANAAVCNIFCSCHCVTMAVPHGLKQFSSTGHAIPPDKNSMSDFGTLEQCMIACPIVLTEIPCAKSGNPTQSRQPDKHSWPSIVFVAATGYDRTCTWKWTLPLRSFSLCVYSRRVPMKSLPEWQCKIACRIDSFLTASLAVEGAAAALCVGILPVGTPPCLLMV